MTTAEYVLFCLRQANIAEHEGRHEEAAKWMERIRKAKP